MTRLLAAALLAAVLAACPGSETGPPKKDLPLVTLPEPTTGPYVSVAVDYHFHDIHPEDHKEIATHRALIFRNEGQNVHNVTIAGTKIDRDIQPGESLRIDPVGSLGGPGTYRVFCEFHATSGMTGVFTVVES